MRAEYDFRGGVRAKYAARYRDGVNVVVLEPDLARRRGTTRSPVSGSGGVAVPRRADGQVEQLMREPDAPASVAHAVNSVVPGATPCPTRRRRSC